MKLIALLAILGLYSQLVTAEVTPTEKIITGEKAENLFKALFKSGIEIVALEDKIVTLNSEDIYCRGSREEATTGGIFENTPDCYAKAKMESGFNFDQKLVDPSQLMTALGEAGADADAAMGSYYISAEKIYCTYKLNSRAYSCQLSTYY